MYGLACFTDTITKCAGRQAGRQTDRQTDSSNTSASHVFAVRTFDYMNKVQLSKCLDCMYCCTIDSV
jgi:hypothetical protein